MFALHGDLEDGYAAVDDFEFLFDAVECPTKPDEPPVTTSTSTPAPDDCTGQLKCADGKGCYAMVKRTTWLSNITFLISEPAM